MGKTTWAIMCSSSWVSIHGNKDNNSWLPDPHLSSKEPTPILWRAHPLAILWATRPLRHSLSISYKRFQQQRRRRKWYLDNNNKRCSSSNNNNKQWQTFTQISCLF